MAEAIKIVVSTHQGKLYDETCDYIVVKNNNGEFAVFANHIPVTTSISEGYVKLVRGNEELFLSVVNGLIEFHNNTCNVVAQEAHVGRDYDSAKSHLAAIREERLEKNRKTNADYTKSEKDIRDNLKNTKAGQL